MRRTKDKYLLNLITLSCLMACVAPAMAADTSDPYVIKESDLIKKENSLTQNPFYAAFFSSLVVYLGPGSMAMHATTTAMGGFLDMLSMYLVAAFLVAYAAERLFKLKPLQFTGIFFAIIGICLWANAQTFHFIFDFF